MQDAEVFIRRNLDLEVPAAELLGQLIAETAWRSEEITLWGKRHLQPRLIAWFGDTGRKYTYSGIAMNPLPWTPMLTVLRKLVERTCEVGFNSVLLNYYRNERDSMGLHSDDESELGTKPIIASLSLGEERILTFKHKRRTDLPTIQLPLESGSLLLMKGETQKNWKHGIAKSTKRLGARVNLTFRRIM